MSTMIRRIAVGVAALGLLVAVAAYAHDRDCGDKAGKHQRMMYNPKTVETITGESFQPNLEDPIVRMRRNLNIV